MSEDKEHVSLIDVVRLHIQSTGPHYEHISEFQTSFFSSVYKRAFLQVDHIIRDFKYNSDYGISLYTSSYYANDKAGVGKDFEKFSNIITFAGKRGSGKTSVMLSFMDALKHYYGYEKRNSKDLFYRFKYVETPLFTCLDCIDGSLLEHGEDIFKVVLAQIYQKFRDLDEEGGISKGEDFAFKKRELFKKLEEIYGTVCDIESMGTGQSVSGESYMSSLQSLSSSQKVKKDFEELIKKFTFLMKYERRSMVEESREHYVVIAIDDIDLNVNNGFSMLEKIHRYCMVENVIVLLAVDMEQMLSIVSKNFYKVLPKVDKLLCEGQDRVHQLATDYISKVMPVNYRIYIPDLSNYYSMDGVFLEKNDSEIKRSLFLELYKKIGICFDSQGVKQHFYEPKSMRQLACFCLMLDSMKNIELNKIYFGEKMSEDQPENSIRIWGENYRILTEELRNRIVVEKLYTQQDIVKFCEMIEKQDIRRAKDEVVNFYRRIRSANQLTTNIMTEDNGTISQVINFNYCENAEIYSPGNTAKKDDGMKSVEDCSYGQLVETIYELGRIEGGRYKTLVHYLLGYFSYVFTRSYIYEKLKIKSNEIQLVKKGTFKALIGSNIVDRWSMEIMPNTIRERNKDVEEQGTASRDKSNKVFEYFSNCKNVTLSNILSVALEDRQKFKEEKKCQYVAKLIRDMELVFLFFSNIKEDKQEGNVDLESDSFKWEFNIRFFNNGKFRIIFVPRIEGSVDISFVGDYSVLNFVTNSIDAVKILEKFENGLIDCLGKQYELLETDNGETKLKAGFKAVLDKYSLKTKFEEWEQKFGRFVLPLPLFWFDFTYNILKRVRREMNEEFIVSSKSEDTFFYIKKLYENIAGQLKEQDKFYQFNEEDKNKGQEEEEAKGQEEEKENAYPYQLAERFERCPVVKYFFEEDKEEEKEKKEFIKNVLSKLKGFSNE